MKPENVFITRDGHVKLLDFGIAKLVETAHAATPHGLMDPTVSPSGSSTSTGIVLGTPGYMSPEQIRGDPIDARTDFFSLGAVLYEMLCGRRSFPGGPVVESGYAILHNEPEPLPAAVPPQVAQVVHRCLEKDTGRRFQTARDLGFNLELLRTPAGSTAPPTTSELAAQSRRWRRWLWPSAAVLVALGGAGVTYFVMRATRLPTPTVERITFSRGFISAGRFGLDGRVVYSAAWGAEPEEIFTHRHGTAESQSLGVHGARLLSVSAQGELAALFRPVGSTVVEAAGTLALVPGTGGAPRELSEDIVWADWSATGELAVVRYLAGNYQIEYPLGEKLFELNGFINFPRVSPSGDAVAFFSLPVGDVPNELMVVDRKGGVRHLLESTGMSGIAWAPSGEEVWFSDGTAIWASPLKGGRRLVYQGVSNLELEDVSRDGKVLVNVEETRREIAIVPPGQQRERELPGLSADFLMALSDDGRQLLLNSFQGGPAVTYLRPTDGSPPLKLGLGYAWALSPDEKWVLTAPTWDSTVLSMLPVGAGVAKKLPVEGFNTWVARWLRNTKRLVITGRVKDEQRWRLYLVPLEEGGVLTAFFDRPIAQYFLEVSRDDRFAAALALDGVLTIYPLDASPPIPLPDLGKFSVPVGWTSEGQLWVLDSLRAFRDAPNHLLRYDIPSRRVVEKRTLAPADLTGLAGIDHICITPDSRVIALEYWRRLGYLSVLDGLASPRR